MKGESRKRAFDISVMVKGLITGTAAGAVLSFLLVILCVYMVIKTQSVPYGAIAPMVIVTACIGAFIGGYLGARVSKQCGLLLGAVCGLLLFLIMLLVGMLSGGTLGTTSLLRFLLTVTAGALGGIAGVNKRKRRK